MSDETEYVYNPYSDDDDQNDRIETIESRFLKSRNERPAVDNTPTWARMVIGAIVVVAFYGTIITLLILAIF